VELVDGEFAMDESGMDEPGMDESGMDEEGRLDLFGGAGVSGDGPPGGGPWDDEVDAGWEPGDQPGAWEDCGDGPEAWLRSLPADLRAEVAARPSLPVLASGGQNAGPLARVGGAEAFADGGFCDTMLPGPELAEMLAEATNGGYSRLSDDALVGILRAWQRQVSSDQSEMVRIIAQIASRRAMQSQRPGWSRVAEHVADELAVELTLTGRSAARLLDVASGLERLPEVNDALLSGFIDWARACVFVDELAVLDEATAAGIAEELADKAAGWTTGQLRAALARAVLTADPRAAELRKKKARKETRVEMWREGSGNAALAGRELAPADVIAADARLRADADWARAQGADGTIAELRAAAFIARLTGRGLGMLLPADASDSRDRSGTGRASPASGADVADSPDPNHPGRGSKARGAGAADKDSTGRDEADAPPPGSVHLIMPLSAWESGGEPGEVAGHGPVDAETSRELAGLLARDPATRWCLTVTGPDGQAVAHACARRGPAAGEPVLRWAAGLRDRLLVLESGTCRHARETAGYVPPPRLRHLVMVRQRRCCFPGCRRPARQCDLDHTIAYDHGGRTCECNLAPLCRLCRRRHNRHYADVLVMPMLRLESLVAAGLVAGGSA
jgi:hypothetical protein